MFLQLKCKIKDEGKNNEMKKKRNQNSITCKRLHINQLATIFIFKIITYENMQYIARMANQNIK